MSSDVLALIALVLLLGVWGWWTWLSLPRDTDKKRIDAWLLRRLGRWYRMWLVRLGLFPVGWPHLIDLAFGAGRLPHATDGTVVWRDGIATLTRLHGSPTHAEPVLVVHSLVTKPWILDLTSRRSLVGMLRDAGFDVYLLDWGDPEYSHAKNGLARHATMLRHAEEAVLRTSGADRLHAVGYCMSATLLLGAQVDQQADHVASLSLIAPAVDFAVPGGFQRWISHPSFRPVLALDGSGGVPATVVREAFHGLRPQAIQSIRLRWARRGDPEYREFYAAMARWAWTHRWLPGALFFDIVDLYRHNPFVPRTGPSPLEVIDVPMLVAIAERDHIVPSGSSHVLTTVPGLDVRVVNVASGHVSMVVGSAARASLWPSLVTFLTEQQSPRPKRGDGKAAGTGGYPRRRG